MHDTGEWLAVARVHAHLCGIYIRIRLCSGHVGNKPVRQQGIKRLEAFAEWAAAQPEDTIVIGGHSLFFREFFRAYLPTGATEGLAGTARKRKIHNCGVVSFKLHAGGEGAFCIDPDSITPVYLGFS